MNSRVLDFGMKLFSIGLIMSSTIERIITYYIDSYFELIPIYYQSVSMFILIVSYILVNFNLKRFVQKEFVVKRIIKNRYIAGRWVEVVLNINNEISHVTKMDISYVDLELYIHGDCYDYLTGQYIYTFKSTCVSFPTPGYELTYLFVATERNRERREDIGHLRFEPDRKRLHKYTGYFEDKGKEYKVAAMLIDDKNCIKAMDEDFMDTFRKEVLSKINKRHNLKEDRRETALVNINQDHVDRLESDVNEYDGQAARIGK